MKEIEDMEKKRKLEHWADDASEMQNEGEKQATRRTEETKQVERTKPTEWAKMTETSLLMLGRTQMPRSRFRFEFISLPKRCCGGENQLHIIFFEWWNKTRRGTKERRWTSGP